MYYFAFNSEPAVMDTVMSSPNRSWFWRRMRYVMRISGFLESWIWTVPVTPVLSVSDSYVLPTVLLSGLNSSLTFSADFIVIVKSRVLNFTDYSF
jgi:hypothetical protein